MAVVAFDELGAVADEVFDEAGGGVVDGADADEAAGTADDFAGDDLAVAGAERVDDFAAGDGGAEEGASWAMIGVVTVQARARSSLALAE